MAVIFTRHARDRMDRDGIAAASVEAVIMKPEHSMPDPDEPALTQAWRRIYYPSGADFVVVTTFPDRGAPRRWRP